MSFDSATVSGAPCTLSLRILLNGGAVIGCMCQELGGASLVSGGSIALLQVAIDGSHGERRLHGIVMLAPEAPK